MTTYIFVIVLVALFFWYRLSVLTLKAKQKDTKHFSEEDALSIQQIHRGLVRMEERIEALETILLDKAEPARETEPADF